MGRAYQNRKESMAKTSDQKAKVYSKYSKEIYMCAKNGGVEPESNLALAGLIDRAKKEQVPAHVIDKALDKAKGGGGEDFAVARYEGYGPANTMVIVECLTDNPNRTFGDVRGCFTKVKAKIGTQGSVSHMFDHSAILSFAGEDDEAVLEALLMADVDVSDVEAEDGKITVFVPQNEYNNAKKALMENFDGIEFEVDEIQFIPKMTKQIDGEDLELFEKFIDLLENVDDVQNIYYDAEF
ncbi:YebC/PmpR family DNA-binding transcriptional regulator [Thiomicrorhabdus sp. 6S3-12]|uniref:YebC/PmpR family DNA-binding transcriptional regulator n=1 Tax=Thiomicrorhabdus sp. 6S3-12 TaxID=2819681 RepID=UPI001AAD6696|nr:YebC/PmpR family DNA-binding transcriptional regulator [Thiomicrorhabdus sp. 6S3-12]MBO1924032.1 YebC/PmpR family DNA-binding transcriptional regulator [Thiomicrorhabdus sp. 6S3-12]